MIGCELTDKLALFGARQGCQMIADKLNIPYPPPTPPLFSETKFKQRTHGWGKMFVMGFRFVGKLLVALHNILPPFPSPLMQLETFSHSQRNTFLKLTC